MQVTYLSFYLKREGEKKKVAVTHVVSSDGHLVALSTEDSSSAVLAVSTCPSVISVLLGLGISTPHFPGSSATWLPLGLQ